MTPKKRKKRAGTRRPSWRGAVREINIHSVTEADEVWIHTHGLREHGLPELEIRGAPTWTVSPGATLLNALADYLVSPARPVRVGDVIRVDGFGMLKLVSAEPREPYLDHYDSERWAVVSAPEAASLCPCCEALGAALH